MIRRTKDYILENKMIKNHSTVLVALSGGADSVCLLLVLNEIKRQCADELDFALEAVHVEHGIRGAESREDARFASDLCERLNIPCHVHSVDVPQYAASHGLGLEEAARILRYEAFEEEAGRYPCETAYAADQKQGNSRQAVVAVAHHMEDNAETVLFQMLRGSGAKGLAGMHPVSVKNGVTYIRPLLSATRAQIEEYLKENGQAFVTDATNTDTAYSRNKLRHDVFPLLLQINDRAIEHINESAGQLAVMNDFYEQQLKEACDSMVSKKEGRVILEISRFESLHPALKSGVARECIHLASGRLKDITSMHIGALVKLAGQQSGRKINLPYGIIAEKSFGEVILFAGRCDDEKEEIHITQKELEALSATGEQKNIRLSADGSYVTLCIQDFNGKMDEIPKKPYTKWFDYDKMKKGFEIRTRKAGDYIIVDDEGHHKKLKQVFTGDKIPAQQRAGLWLIAHESLVHAIIGYRSGCGALVTPQTGKVLKITFYGGKQNGFFKKYDISVYLTEEQLNKRIAEIGAQITEKYRGQSVYLICILKGSIFFTTELAKRIDLPMTMDFMSVSSYGSGTESSGDVKIKKDLEHSIEGENVIIIEDIIDSGNTLSRLSKLLAKRNPKSLTICTLLDKPERRVVDDVNVDYVGFVIPDKFVVGYGLDYDQRFRNLPYIGFVEGEIK